VDGNKRLGLAAVLAFYGLNGYRLTMTNDEAYEFVMATAAGDLDDLAAIADRLADAATAAGS
jgi:death-on-curing protein